MRVLSPNGLALLRRLEGVRAQPYLDEAGHPTIGVGHLIRAAELGLKSGAPDGEIFAASRVRWPKGLTDAEIDALLARDVVPFEAAVNTLGAVLGEHQFDALVIFAFNIGAGQFGVSNVARAVRSRRFNDVPGALAQWNKIRDPKTRELVVSPGLVKRRAAEAARWQGVA